MINVERGELMKIYSELARVEAELDAFSRLARVHFYFAQLKSD